MHASEPDVDAAGAGGRRPLDARGVQVLLVHVLLAAVAGAALLIWGAGSDPADADRKVSLPDPDPRRPAAAPARVIGRPAGPVVLDTGLSTNTPLASVLPQVESTTLSTAGVVRVRAIVTRQPNGLTLGLWQFSVRDKSKPADALTAIDKLYDSAGFAQPPDGPPGVRVRHQAARPEQGNLGVYRAHYLHGHELIRVEAYGSDKTMTDAEFAALIGAQTAAWPPRESGDG
ncbi:hypothetical protein EV193_10527 [Herbihabitans rhizosphaerae]|uniref:Uncharacterized protein n=1 Tax=Herbihabitans rhizosphaerae TaxID=1872711 RepID=A0A4Q7KQ91_9PSEU|nr:hypothetical protein [Herbihabitans rhizosphaerae]RZS37472.1 hypothetical protein EV193_10527 [Herbihabitans rhizosphaerae]